MIDYKEVFKAWIVSFNPNDTQKELAEERLNICMGCEYRKEVLKGVRWSALCGECGCPISKKIFSKNYNACPKKKWEDIDSNYISPLADKDDNSII